MREYQLFINGKFIPNGDRKMIDVINPATEEAISKVPAATKMRRKFSRRIYSN